MCVMFRDKWIIRFFKFPFCGDFSLDLQYQETSRELKTFKGMFLKLANADINIACLMNGRKHRIVITRSCTNLMIKAQQDTNTNKSKAPETSTWATLVCSTQSPNLVSNKTPIFLKSLSVKLPDGMPGEALNLCAKFSESLFLSVSSLSSVSEIQTSKVACVALNRRKYLKEKPVF